MRVDNDMLLSVVRNYFELSFELTCYKKDIPNDSVTVTSVTQKRITTISSIVAKDAEAVLGVFFKTGQVAMFNGLYLGY